MFNGSSQAITIPSPSLGINTNESNNTSYAKYLQNIVIENGTCSTRFGTQLVQSHTFDSKKLFTDSVAVMSFLTEQGDSEKLIYQNYLSKIPHINHITHIVINKLHEHAVTIDISITSLSDIQKKELQDGFEENNLIHIRQESVSESANISHLNITETNIVFHLPYGAGFFDADFELFWEKGAIYKLLPDGFALLIDNLNPNVIVSSVIYLGHLIIANGVDPVLVYDGITLSELKANYPVINTKAIIIVPGSKKLLITIPRALKDFIFNRMVVGSDLYNENDNKIGEISAVTYTLVGAEWSVTITFANMAQNISIRKVFFKVSLPSFAFIGVAHNRLWATPPDRNRYGKFRTSNHTMKVYYAAKSKTVFNWFSENNGELGFIDLSTNIPHPDNIEAIVPYQDKILFLARDSLQVYGGIDPTINKLGKDDISFPDFQFEKIFNIGIFQKNLFVEMPNDIIFFSKYGLVSISSINQYQQLAVGFSFSAPVNDYINTQLRTIDSDKDYRQTSLFLYSYGRFIGLKLKYNCLIYQIKQRGIWTIFSGDFNSCKSFHYDKIDKNLYMVKYGGDLLFYGDKVEKLTYSDYASGNISWKIHLPWLYTQKTWNNEIVSIACKTLSAIDVKLNMYVDYDESDRFEEVIVVDKVSLIYNYTHTGVYYDNPKVSNFPHEAFRFSADSVMVTISGISKDHFIFDKLFLRGGFKDDS